MCAEYQTALTAAFECRRALATIFLLFHYQGIRRKKLHCDIFCFLFQNSEVLEGNLRNNNFSLRSENADGHLSFPNETKVPN